MATARGTWKQRERDAAKIFGAKRQIGSGSGGRADQTCSDSLHPRVFLETKYRAASAVRTLWEKTAVLAKKEKKTPVLAIFDKGKHGPLLVMHEDDFATLAAEYVAAQQADAERAREEAFS